MTAKTETFKIKARLYDADGVDREIKLNGQGVINIGEKQLLWISNVPRNAAIIKEIERNLAAENLPVESIMNLKDRPGLTKYENFYHFFTASAEIDETDNLFPVPIDFVVGKNFVLAVHDAPVAYFEEFGEREKGETQIGELDAESFLSTLLDMHIMTYFRALELIENTVDRMDEQILSKDLNDEVFFAQTVKLRIDVSKLRRWLMPHRDVFYALSRSDFRRIADSDSFENFQLLNDHFEHAMEAIENSRNSVFSLFDLYVSKSSHKMNRAMKRLTFTTILVGGMGVVAGIFGMNFEEEFFKNSTGFWLAISFMISMSGILTMIAWKRNWL